MNNLEKFDTYSSNAGWFNQRFVSQQEHNYTQIALENSVRNNFF